MTREEQINKEAYRQEGLVDMDVESFIAGAKWADANPKSSWISVEDDLPCNHSEHKYHEKASSTKDVLIRRADNSYSIDCMMVRDKKWDWVLSSLIGIYPTHWFPIPELPKE